jgi:hypothetical protein
MDEFCTWFTWSYVSTQQTTFQHLLHGPAAIQNAMNKDRPANDLIDDSVRLEMSLQVIPYTDTFEFRRSMASPRHICQALAGLAEFSQDISGAIVTVNA